MEGKTWLPNFLPISLQGIVIDIASGAQICRVQRSIRVKDFCIANRDGLSFFPANTQAYPTNHVLTHVEDPVWVRKIGNFTDIDWPQFFLAFDHRSIRRNENS